MTTSSKAFSHDFRIPPVGSVVSRFFRDSVYVLEVVADGFLMNGEHVASLNAATLLVDDSISLNRYVWWGFRFNNKAKANRSWMAGRS